MAYLCIIASVPRDRVEQIRVPADVARLSSRVAYVSHLIAPVSTELRDAMDGGTPLETNTWHPLRSLRFHETVEVQAQAARLATLTAQMHEPECPFRNDTWTQAEASKVADLFQHASVAGEAVITHLDLTRTKKSVI
jgi:hypothetical protein